MGQGARRRTAAAAAAAATWPARRRTRACLAPSGLGVLGARPYVREEPASGAVRAGGRRQPALRRYVAGLWDASLREGVLFDVRQSRRSERGDDGASRPGYPGAVCERELHPAGACTWSWASFPLDGGGAAVSYDRIVETLERYLDINHFRYKHISVVEAEANLATNNRFGWVVKGRLTVRGVVGIADSFSHSFMLGPRRTQRPCREPRSITTADLQLILRYQGHAICRSAVSEARIRMLLHPMS